MIDNKLILEDTGLAKKIVTAAGYAFYNEEVSRSKKDDLIVVIWNWWILN